MSAVLSYPLRAWIGLAQRWRDANQRRHCATRAGTRILPGGCIVNQQDARDAISLGANSWIAGQLLVYAHAGRIEIGDFCYVGENAKYRGKDLITIHESTHGDGVFDKTTIFLDGMNLATAALKGRGGVYVMCTPYLLFYPCTKDPDHPDSDKPQVLLSAGRPANGRRRGPSCAARVTTTAALFRPADRRAACAAAP